MSMSLQVAIDGTVASGKDTVAYRLAERIDAVLIETGSLFRAAAWLLMTKKVDLEPPQAAIEILQSTNFSIVFPSTKGRKFDVVVDGQDVSDQLRTAQVAMQASYLARQPQLRQVLIAIKKKMAKEHRRVIMTGRGIGRMVLPKAHLKVYLTAQAQIRAQRRFEQEQASGGGRTYEEVLLEVEERDRINRQRSFDPDVPTKDALVIDTSSLDIEGVVERIYQALPEQRR